MSRGRHIYEWPRPALTVDAVVFGHGPGGLEVLLIRRDREPYASAWALPGGFVDADEDPAVAVRRELAEEAGLTDVALEQLHTFGAPGRDPRGWTVSVAWMALVRPSDHHPVAGDDAREAAWHPVDALPPLAFDHRAIIDMAVARLRVKVRWHPIGLGLLPDAFTLGDLQRLYEAVLGRAIDKRNFRRRIAALGLVVDTGMTTIVDRRHATRLWRFDHAAWRRLIDDGADIRII